MSLITAENSKPGSTDWQLTRMRLDKNEGIRTSFIEGYCSRQSVKAGETLDIFVSTKPASRFKLEVFRSGYYGRRGARLMGEYGPFEGKEQIVPEIGGRRLRECRWDKTTSITIPQDWLSGVYLGRLTTLPASPDEPYWQSYVVFIVKDDRKADILLQCSDNTWQAYNRWPDTFSLYDDGVHPGMVSPPGIDISFDRPYGKYRQIYENPQSVGSGEWLCFEFPMAYWLEQRGYDVTYCSNSDMVTPERGFKCKAWISGGHDEYWDVRQYHSAMAMRDAGVSLLFLSGNSVCWVSPFRDSSTGVPNRIITREAPYAGLARQQKFDELKKFEGHTTGPDEGLLMGAINVIPVNGGGDWICTQPEHWLFEGTGMKKGDSIPGMVGWEYHGDPAKIPGLEVVAGGTAWQSGVNPQQWTATIYPGPKNNFVFNAATIWWAQGLSKPPGHMPVWSHYSRPHGPDPRVQRITENLLRRAIGN
ncbi:N,N-dimethylformamidase beta subunit family domain-containing protein [Prosthecobacter vanneervenii]|uniref:N,N-dimethylformamidase beta subunit-like C-terminal domain-containing protein n=1 Tax=Prosthecobacter vanneervenii TaxID=48466 RepID=A0A7W7Y6T3_9BACT|nr:N,N-dimethylformamidase beta subunit family domain-containing protein [Prosthecobacter vanneervenii]MBB5030669.1 hypothetical protein [Prosthecobacter vanneervenii]